MGATHVLVSQLSYTPVPPANVGPEANMQLKQLFDIGRHLIKQSDNKRTDSVMGVIGLGGKALYSPPHRLAARLIGTSILWKIKDDPRLAMADMAPLRASVAKQSELLMLNLSQFAKAREFVGWADNIALATSILTAEDAVPAGPQVFAQVVGMCYQGVVWLEEAMRM